MNISSIAVGMWLAVIKSGCIVVLLGSAFPTACYTGADMYVIHKDNIRDVLSTSYIQCTVSGSVCSDKPV